MIWSRFNEFFYNFFQTHPWLVYNFFAVFPTFFFLHSGMTWSWFVHNLVKSCLHFVYDSFFHMFMKFQTFFIFIHNFCSPYDPAVYGYIHYLFLSTMGLRVFQLVCIRSCFGRLFWQQFFINLNLMKLRYEISCSNIFRFQYLGILSCMDCM